MNMNRFSYKDDIVALFIRSKVSETTQVDAPRCGHIMGYSNLFKSCDPPRWGRFLLKNNERGITSGRQRDRKEHFL